MHHDRRTVDRTTRELRLTWQDPLATAGLVRESSGIEALRMLIDRRLLPPIMGLLNIWPIEVEDGRIVFEGEPGEEHYNPIGSIHGGFAMSILDSALGCAIHIGRTTAVSEARLTDASGRLLATATTACAIFRPAA